jgi:hypothetical protein
MTPGDKLLLYLVKANVYNSQFFSSTAQENARRGFKKKPLSISSVIRTFYKLLATPTRVIYSSRVTYWSRIGDVCIHRFFHSTLSDKKNELIICLDELNAAPAYSNVLSISSICRLASSFNRIYCRMFKKKDLSQTNLALKRIVRNLTNVEHDLEQIVPTERILNTYQSILMFEKIFYYYLRFKYVREIFFTCFYSAENLGMILAAKKLGIKTYDIQHGVINKFHSAYNSYDEELKFLPDELWLWSDSEFDILSKIGWPIQKLKVKDNQYNLIDYKAFLTPAQKTFLESRESEKKITILVALQTIVFEYDDFLKYFESIIRGSTESTYWLIRLHPGTLSKDRVPTHNFTNVDIVHSSEALLPAIINSADILITLNSSIVLDFSKKNKPIIFLREEDKDYYGDLIATDNILIFNPQEGIEKFNQLLTDILSERK